MQQRPDGKPERAISHRGMSRTACWNPVRRTLREDGVSEAVGTILLISVIALGIAVFAAAFFSQQAVPVLPSVTFNVTYGDDGSVAIRHLGGDMIPRDQLRIYIDNGTAVLGNEALSRGGDAGTWTAWSIGDILVYDPPEPLPGATEIPKSEVLMVYADRSGGEYLMYLSEGWGKQSPTTWLDTLLNTPNGKPGDLMPGGYLAFRVLKPGIWVDAYVITTNARYDLKDGDTVKLVIGTKGKGEIYINGPMLSTFDYDDVTLYINGEQMETGDIVSIFFRLENISSTLTLSVPSSSLWTEFKVDDKVLIYGEDSREITLYNLMPRKDGLMNLNNRPNLIWFQGSITDYTFE